MSNFTIIVSGIKSTPLRRAAICAMFPLEAWSMILVNGSYLVGILGVALYRGLGLSKLIQDVRRVW